MHRYASILLAAVLLAGAAQGDVAPDEGRWSATAVPWKKNLPTVQVTFGYPGGYMPARNSPIEMSVTAADSAFDGYIGFRFVVGRMKTSEVPVLSRAAIAAGGNWKFSTFAQLRIPSAESERSDVDFTRRVLQIGWFDASHRLLAQARLGKLPWTPTSRPLYITGRNPARPLTAFNGVPTVVLPPQQLANSAQWFSGFTAAIAAVDDWLDLPPATRKTLFHSGIRIVTFGFPRPDQAFAEVDRAAIPVGFSAGSSSTEVPWVYGERRVISAPFRWRPHGPGGASPAASPYFAIDNDGIWVVEQSALQKQLPTVSAWSLFNYKYSMGRASLLATILNTAAEFRGLACLVLAVLASVVVWILIRSRLTPAAVLASVVVVFAALAARTSIRPTTSVKTIETRRFSRSDTVVRIVSRSFVGRSPIDADPVDDVPTWSGRLSDNVTEEGEVRNSETLPGHGAVFVKSPWDNTIRDRFRRELAQPPAARIVQADESRIVIDFEQPVRADFVTARWSTGSDRSHVGEQRVTPSSKRVTIESGHNVPDMYWLYFDEYWPQDYRYAYRRDVDEARISLVSSGRQGQTTTILPLPIPRQPAFMPYQMGDSRAVDGVALLKLPQTTPPPDALLHVSIGTHAPVPVHPLSAAATGCKGSIDLASAAGGGRAGVVGTWRYELPFKNLASILCDDNLLKITFTPDKPDQSYRVSLSVRKKGTHEW